MNARIRSMFAFCCVFLCFLVPSCLSSSGGGTNCAIGTSLISLVEEESRQQGTNITSTITDICADINASHLFDWLCDHALDRLAPQVERDFKLGLSPDHSARALGFCTNPECNLWGKQTHHTQYKHTHNHEEDGIQFSAVELDFSSFRSSPSASAEWLERNSEKINNPNKQGMHTIGIALGSVYQAMFRNSIHPSVRPPISPSSPLGQLSSSSRDPLLPAIDIDGDSFSVIRHLRGSDWRGKDCDDIDNTIYPGRRTTTHSDSMDHNCNGIAGHDESGRSYEELFCSNTTQYGVIAVGDSATAHFSIPPAWFTSPITNRTYKNVLPALTDSLDWPFCSWATAHVNDSAECPAVLGPVLPIRSVYSAFRSRNLCSHRDYANLGVNGASSVSLPPPTGDLAAFTRDRNDQPAIVLYSLIGNDVCGNSLDFTPVDVFYAATMKSLTYLDSVLPSGSIVITTGLVDGRILYEAVSKSLHPIGVPYPAFYTYLNCLSVSPCLGWMNINATIRDQTTAHAELLNLQYGVIEKQQNFKNFKLKYFYFDVQKMLSDWVKQGQDPLDLIERVDGFHPSQTGNAMWLQQLLAFLEAEFPEALPPINNMNEEIIAKFGEALNGY